MRTAQLFVIALVTLNCGGCSSHADPKDACAVLTKTDVEKTLGAKVNEPIVEAAKPISIVRSETMQTLAGCIYLPDAGADKPARVAIHVKAFRPFAMFDAYWEGSRFSTAEFSRARRIPGIGEEAWQGQGIKFKKGTNEILIEVDDLPAVPPAHDIHTTLPTRLYPDLEVALARIAADRL